jgi:hypothetical protein
MGNIGLCELLHTPRPPSSDILALCRTGHMGDSRLECSWPMYNDAYFMEAASHRNGGGAKHVWYKVGPDHTCKALDVVSNFDHARRVSSPN